MDSGEIPRAFDRPFWPTISVRPTVLAPVYSLAAGTRRRYGKKVDLTKLLPYVLFILFHLRERLTRRRTIHCKRGRPRAGICIERFRSDAKAEGEAIVIGGYETHSADGRPIEHRRARWFKMELTRSSAPWAYSRGEPYRSIASLELLGTLVSTMLLLDGEEDVSDNIPRGTLSAGALTDNLGNRFSVAKLLSTKWPLTAFVVELACQLEHKNVLLDMAWVPRAQNAEADAITNGDTHWLSPKNRVTAEMDRLPFLMLHELLAKGEEFYQNLELVNVSDNTETPTTKVPLRVRDPWNE